MATSPVFDAAAIRATDQAVHEAALAGLISKFLADRGISMANSNVQLLARDMFKGGARVSDPAIERRFDELEQRLARLEGYMVV